MKLIGNESGEEKEKSYSSADVSPEWTSHTYEHVQFFDSNEPMISFSSADVSHEWASHIYEQI